MLQFIFMFTLISALVMIECEPGFISAAILMDVLLFFLGTSGIICGVIGLILIIAVRTNIEQKKREYYQK